MTRRFPAPPLPWWVGGAFLLAVISVGDILPRPYVIAGQCAVGLAYCALAAWRDATRWNVLLCAAFAGAVLAGDVDLVEALGSELLVHFTIDAKRAETEGRAGEQGEGLATHGEGIAKAGPKAPVRSGARARFLVDAAQMHFFDLETGNAITG